MKYLLFVDHPNIAETLIKKFGEESIAEVYNFSVFENYPSDILPEELPINGIEKYSQGGGNEYQAIISIDVDRSKGRAQFGQSFWRRLAFSIERTLKKRGINFILFNRRNLYMNVRGKFPNVTFSPSEINIRTIDLIQETLQAYSQEFANKELDFWIDGDDYPNVSLDFAEALDLPYIFNYCTSYSLKDRVIALPDYDTCYNEEKFSDKSRTFSKCREVAATSWQDKRAFWRGSLFTSNTRRFLLELGKKYPEYFRIEDSSYGQYIPMVEQAKYKYLIDTRGNSFSVRLQTLLKLGRVVFIVERPCREWYFDRLIPMKHYVPVKEDMSDLLDKYFYMEHHPELYEKIVRNLAEFVEENFNPRRILFDTKELLLKYGVIR